MVVRHPVICGNYHVFCSTCIEVWLKKANQCPTCRTPITPENPCREIIGTLSGMDSDEIDSLQKENEELRSRNLTLEEQLKTALGSSSFQVSDKSEDVKQSFEGGRIDPHFLEEWTRNLAAATELQEKLQVEIEKLKEANKTLRTQNVDLVRENSYLKAEVASRSPQKFGRYTVAALEAKISQYERDLKHLQKALERTDKYIEELEAQVSESQMTSDKTAAVKNSGYVLQEMMNEHQAEEGVAGQGHCTMTGYTKTVTMKDSLGDVESSSVSIKGTSADSSGPCDFFLTSKTLMTGIFCDKNGLEQNFTPEKTEHVSSMEHSIPSTPSSPFSCLTLKSPSICNDQQARRKPLSYLRKLSFDDCSSGLSAAALKNSVTPSCASGISTDHKSALKSSSPVCWEACTQKSPRSSCFSEPDKHPKDREKDQRQRTSIDASMDATYLDKVYELDSVISEGRS
ncbi:RING finger protein 219-like [Scleropages formosus]|uniref:RING finger protein 219-like n=1 Tax=Scleropages formosus TaxID=113540 RepID=A0A0P7UHF8_SCLFO|nr:RING finger protein 219-like [Scleropages formosus]